MMISRAVKLLSAMVFFLATAVSQSVIATGDAGTGDVTVGVANTASTSYTSADVTVKDSTGTTLITFQLVPGQWPTFGTATFEATPGAVLTVEVKWSGPIPIADSVDTVTVEWE